MNFLSFFVIHVEGKDEDSNKHFQTLNEEEYENSELKKIVKRKVDKHPKSEQV